MKRRGLWRTIALAVLLLSASVATYGIRSAQRAAQPLREGEERLAALPHRGGW